MLCTSCSFYLECPPHLPCWWPLIKSSRAPVKWVSLGSPSTRYRPWIIQHWSHPTAIIYYILYIYHIFYIFLIYDILYIYIFTKHVAPTESSVHSFDPWDTSPNLFSIVSFHHHVSDDLIMYEHMTMTIRRLRAVWGIQISLVSSKNKFAGIYWFSTLRNCMYVPPPPIGRPHKLAAPAEQINFLEFS